MRWLVGAVVVVALAAGLFVWLRVQPAVPRGAVSGPAASAAPAERVGPAASARAPRPAWVPVAPPVAMPAGAAVWDLCGVGRLPRPADAKPLADDGLAELPPHLGAEPAAAALEQMVSRMDAGNAGSRAAAVLLRGFDAQNRPLPEALQALAEDSADAAASAWAAVRCQGPAVCQKAATRWTQREPANAAAWLNWLLHHPGRVSEIEAALARSTRFTSHEPALLTAALAAVPADVPAYLEPALWVYVIGVQAALPLPYLGLAGLQCRQPALAAPARRAACEQLARAMTQAGDTPIALYVGKRLAERMQWPAPELAALQQRIVAANTPGPWLDAAQPLSCASIDAQRQRLQAKARP